MPNLNTLDQINLLIYNSEFNWKVNMKEEDKF